MTVTDFSKNKYGYWISNEKYLFSNEKVEFYYRWKIGTHTYQPGWIDDWNTRYTVSILVDIDSRHEIHKNTDLIFEDRLYCFIAQTREIRHARFSEKDLERIIKGIDKIKVENKIKRNNYEQITASLNGGHFRVF